MLFLDFSISSDIQHTLIEGIPISLHITKKLDLSHIFSGFVMLIIAIHMFTFSVYSFLHG